MQNPKAIPILVDGKEFGVVWQDFRSFKRLSVYLNDKRMAWIDWPIRVDQGDGILKYFIRSVQCK